jgi:hypothetical protein
MVGSNIFSGWLAKGALTLAAGAFVASMAVPASAGSLRRATAGGASNSGAAGAGAGGDPGEVLYGYFDQFEPSFDNGTGNGDNVMRLINTTGSNMCALIYVFDDDEELGACCGCPMTANELQSYSIARDLTSSWREATDDIGNGVIAVIGATSATNTCTLNGASIDSGVNPACTAGCDPTIPFSAGVLTQGTPSGQGINGNILHNQKIGSVSGLTEVNMFDDSPGDSNNTAALLQAQCANIVQHGSGLGICRCRGEISDVL